MPSSNRWDAYQSGANMGIDLKRSVIGSNIGTYVVNATTTFRAGMLVSLNASQEIVICPGANPFGFAKYDKTTALYVPIVDEYIQLTGTTATSLTKSNLLTAAGGAAAVRVSTAVQGGGTTYTEGAGSDYTVNYTNGTVVRTAGSTIVSGGYVYVTYAYQMPLSELQFEGRDFFNSLDYTEFNDGRMTVINNWSTIFTTQYDPSQIYAVNSVVESGASGDSLSGLVTLSGVGAGPDIGTVMQVPTAADPYLGIRYKGGV